MNYHSYRLLSKSQTAEDTFIYRFSPDSTSPLLFKPGQYVFITNPQSENPLEPHPFSIASSPLQTDYLEFCIKTYGDWTKELEQSKEGQTFLLSDPQGNFTWDSSILHTVFLLGGIGISPIISMLRFMLDMKLHPKSLIMMYGNRTPDTVAYRKELEEIQNLLPMLKIVDIYSHLPDNHPWTGYKGFITQEIIEKEVNLTLKPTFFYIGPPIFIEKMDSLLDQLSVPQEKRRKEDFAAVQVNKEYSY